MTPEETEARFQRIEATLQSTAERQDDSAEQIQLLLISMNRLAESAIRYDRLHGENEQYKLENEQWKRENEQYKRENDQRFNTLLAEVRTSVQENQEWKRENDQRFNILLEEVRASNRRISNLEDP